MAYSPEFEAIIRDPGALLRATSGSFAPTEEYAVWEDKRRFIADLIPQGGTVLDIGCANGFFLLSLREWTGLRLEVYGVDLLETAVDGARRLFPAEKEHFAVMDARSIEHIGTLGLPQSYDIVCWNVPSGWPVERGERVLRAAARMARRRFIAAWYGENRHPIGSPGWDAERSALRGRAREFAACGIPFVGTLENPTGYNQIVSWIDAPPTTAR